MTPKDSFHCERYHCILSARACVLRQQKRPRIRHGKGKRESLLHSHCMSGKCLQGKEVALRVEGQPIEPVKNLSMKDMWAARKKAWRLRQIPKREYE